MKIKYITPIVPIKKASMFLLAVLMLVGVLSSLPGTSSLIGKASAACLATAPPTTYGQVTQTVTVATAGTYRVWSRVKAPDTTANSYYFQADGGCAYNVGDAAAIPANTWTWVNYQDGTTSSTVNITLTAGSHTLTYTGKEANVQLDKVMLLTDTSCVPTGVGDNCAFNDSAGPTTSITSPTAGSTVSGIVTIAATATDTSGVAKVEFLIDNVVVATDTTSAYSYSWDTKTATNGAHNLTVKSYDSSGNGGNTTTTAATNVTVNNPTPDTTKPAASISAPTSGTSVTAGTAVTINATATDNVGVTKVEFNVDGVVKNTDTASPYSYVWDTTGATVGVHNLTVTAYDAANNSIVSNQVSVTVGSVPPGNGDVNLDGRVNALDLSSLISHDGQNFPAADFNHDGTVGAADMAILLAKWTW